ncbi:hypothetical protein PRUPE_1G297600 [Prunus persica]|uniref:Uncharacterized protein n=1 Tax=Prunus persica TaxID=3760 RepID=A0A251R579_PRUPE|nr:hypothetical protein PRUPE_1G297600 [Prunus persica]
MLEPKEPFLSRAHSSQVCLAIKNRCLGQSSISFGLEDVELKIRVEFQAHLLCYYALHLTGCSVFPLYDDF